MFAGSGRDLSYFNRSAAESIRGRDLILGRNNGRLGERRSDNTVPTTKFFRTLCVEWTYRRTKVGDGGVRENRGARTADKKKLLKKKK